MELLVQPEPSTLSSTPGTLSIDGVFECYTLEDVVREVPGQPVAMWKVQNETAIPAGRYQVIIDVSEHFNNRLMPHILNVPGYDGVRIHSGNTAADTDGCILLGKVREVDDVSQSHDAYNSFFSKLQAAVSGGEPVHITVAAARPLATTSIA
ncbi:MAG TPA: DUF5675 family protein [Terriglobales bacterium]